MLSNTRSAYDCATNCCWFSASSSVGCLRGRGEGKEFARHYFGSLSVQPNLDNKVSPGF